MSKEGIREETVNEELTIDWWKEKHGQAARRVEVLNSQVDSLVEAIDHAITMLDHTEIMCQLDDDIRYVQGAVLLCKRMLMSEFSLITPQDFDEIPF